MADLDDAFGPPANDATWDATVVQPSVLVSHYRAAVTELETTERRLKDAQEIGRAHV